MKIQYLQKVSRIEDHYAKQNKLDLGKNHHIFFIMQNGIPLSDGLLPEITNGLVAITSRTRKERVKKSYFIEKTFSNKGNDI